MPQITLDIPTPWVGKKHEEVCKCLFEYLLSTRKENLETLSYMAIARICNNNKVDSVVLESTAYFCGAVNILQSQFIFIDEDDNEHPLERGEFYLAQETGYLIHPESGDEVTDYEDKVFVYFHPTKQFLEQYK